MSDADLIPAHLIPVFELGWESRSACRGEDPDQFYPAARGDRAVPVYRRLATKFCHVCPVRSQCLFRQLSHESGAHHYRYGLAGGLNPRQRTDRALQLHVLAGGVPPLAPFESRRCACGCGTEIVDQPVGRPRRFAEGHKRRPVVAA